MKNLITKIKVIIWLAAIWIVAGCEKEIPEPIADFRILDESTINEVNPDEIVANTPIVFENKGSAQYLTLWTGDEGSVYTSEPEELSLQEIDHTYVNPDGEKITYTAILVNRSENEGNVVSTKTGQESYTYHSAGLAGDTTYVVTWIATNVDVHGNTRTAMKQLTVRVRTAGSMP